VNCPNCKSYFPDMEKACPYCGCAVSKADKKAARNQQRQDFERRQADPTVKAKAARLRADEQRAVAAVLIDTTEDRSKSVVRMAGRGFVGGLIAGQLGTAVGLLTAKDRVKSRKATFSVKYASGRRDIETVDVGSKRYQELAELLLD